MAPDPQSKSPPSADSGAAPGKWRRLWQGQRENVRVLAIALLLALVLRFWVAEPRYIPSNSMEPTLQVGDRILVEKVSYRFHPPQPGDIVVFRPPAQLYPYGYTDQQAFIKRVVGTPGHTVAVRGGQVYVDGQPQAEAYIQAPPTYDLPPVPVPAGSLLVLGDNRNDSNDSHVWGLLPQSQLIGHTILRFWPLTTWRWFS